MVTYTSRIARLGRLMSQCPETFFARECRISALGGSVSKNVIIRNSNSVLGAERIFGDIFGSVWIESGGSTPRL